LSRGILAKAITFLPIPLASASGNIFSASFNHIIIVGIFDIAVGFSQRAQMAISLGFSPIVDLNAVFRT